MLCKARWTGGTKSRNGEMRNEKLEMRKWKRKWKWSSHTPMLPLASKHMTLLINTIFVINSNIVIMNNDNTNHNDNE